MKHKKAIVIFLLVTLLIAGTLCAMLIQSSREELNVRKSNSNMDYATQFVIDNKLLQVCDYPIGESSISVTGYYYDGVRLYLRVSSSNDVLDDTGTDDFKLLSNGHTYLPHTALMIDDIDGLGNMTTKMLIFNTMIEANLDDMALAFQLDNETNSFSAEDVPINIFEKRVDYEEITLNKVMFGRTSTYYECDIYARIEGKTFQAVIGDIVVPIYLINKEDNHFKFLVPYAFDNCSSFVFVSNSTNGVELRVLIDFSNTGE